MMAQQLMGGTKRSLPALALALLLGLAGCSGSSHTAVEVPSSPEDAVFRSYLAAVQARLYEQKYLMAPFYGVAKEPAVHVAILLDPSGIELGSGIRQSSGSPDVDATALAMVARASPFPPPPKELMKSDKLGISIAMPLPKTRREWREAFQ